MKWLFVLVALWSVVPSDAAVRYRGRSSLEIENEAPRVSAMPSVGVDLKYWPVSYGSYEWGQSLRSAAAGHGFHLGLEWLAVSGRVGKLGLGLGLGAGVIQALGTQLSAYPVEALASYRLDFVRNQILVPYVKGGAGVTFTAQQGRVGLQNYQGWTYGGGIEICLNSLDSQAAKMIDRTHGIRATYIVVEFMRSVPLKERRSPDLSGDQWRVGLRFEI